MQVGERHHVAHADDVLGNAHCPHHGHGLGRAHDLGGPLEVRDWNAGDFSDLFGRILHHRRFELIKTFTAFLDEFLVLPAFFEEDVHQAVEQGDVAAGPVTDVQRGEISEINAARVSDDQFDAAPAYCPPQHRPEDGMLLGGVRADDEQRLGVIGNIVHRVGHCARAVGGGQTGHGAGVTETGAVVYVVRPDNLAGELVHQVVFFIQAFG